jgi:uncharacterized protein YdaU (DUF1376 family)
MKRKINPVFYVHYEARRMIVSTANLPPLAELAHRRLSDWTWTEGHAPPNDAATLAAISRCSPEEWPQVRQALRRNGWTSNRRSFSHPDALRTLRQALIAHSTAMQRGAKGARTRWRARKPSARARPKPCSSHAQAMLKHSSSNAQADAQALLKHSSSSAQADAQALLKHSSSSAQADAQAFIKHSSSNAQADAQAMLDEC